MAKKLLISPRPIFDSNEQLFNEDGVLPYSIPVGVIPVNLKFDAQSDLTLAISFLYQYKENPHTLVAYRGDLERFLLWSWIINKTSILDLNEDDLGSYLHFFKNPPSTWIGTSTVRRHINQRNKRIPNPTWRPFVARIPKSVRAAKQENSNKDISVNVSDYSPSSSTIAAVVRALSSFYEWLTRRKYIGVNYVKLIAQKREHIGASNQTREIMRLTNLQWDYVIETAELMAEENPDQHERTLFIMSILFLMYLRISELVHDNRSEPQMGDFYTDNDGNWWFKVVGKGVKRRDIPVADEMLLALKRFRLSRNLSPYPAHNEHSPLITSIRGASQNSNPITSTRQIRKIVQYCFDQAYLRMRQDKHITDREASTLQAATVHWLRHTGISEDVKNRPQEHVREDAGHSSIVTTSRYIDADKRERHQSAKQKTVKDL